MNPLMLKRKMFEEMKDVSKADGADALRSKYGPTPPPDEPMSEEGMEGDTEPVPGTEGQEEAAEGDMPPGGEKDLEALLSKLSPEELKALLAGK